jgi:glycine/D-amino acid oxidase-like deaminating enzyme
MTPSAALADAEPAPYWLAAADAPAARAPLQGRIDADLLVIGGGLTGLWTALQALEERPGASVVLLEADRVASGASGRNGGFCSPSLTHGVGNGLARWPREMPALQRLGRENIAGMRTTLATYTIDCHLEDGGELRVATRKHELAGLAEEAQALGELGDEPLLLDGESVRDEVASPTYLGGLWQREHHHLLDPARLCWGLADAIIGLGGAIHEATVVEQIVASGDHLEAETSGGTVRADRAVLATSAYPPLLRAIRRYVLPVYDYVLATEPLARAQLDALGWRNRQGVADSGNRFHYYRLTRDDRILWGGYDAIYHFGNAFGPQLEQRPQTFELLAEHFAQTFPQLEGVRFTHRWGGAIDTCSRFSAMFGRALEGRAVYAVGFTGLGVGASRFAARVALDLAAGETTERTRLEMVRRRPVPFPPEPLRSAVVNLTRRELARADRRDGRRGLWLRALDRMGLGFDS